MHKKTLGLAAAVVAAGLLASTPVAAATKDVEATSEKRFDPSTVTATVGGNVHWFSLPDGVDHTVTQNSQLFDSGAVKDAFNFTQTFSAGTYPYHCEKHGTPTSGMRGTVKVPPQVSSAPAGLAFTVKWAAAVVDTGTTFDVKYRVASGPWKTWKTNTTAKSLVFGKAGPVGVARGKTYSFTVVSREGTKKSLVSPAKSFRAS
jgi:plastocyanin